MKERIVQAEMLLDKFGWEIEHCRQVRTLALMLFDQLQRLHGMGDNERDILEAAALLHDIGWTGGGAKHHKRSAQLIREQAGHLTGFSDVEIGLIANVARYHRKADPSPQHEPFAALLPEQQTMVRRLTALLRLADGLDRPHLQWVAELVCEVTDRQVLIQVRATAEAGLHIAGASRKRGLFEAVFQRPIEFCVLTRHG